MEHQLCVLVIVFIVFTVCGYTSVHKKIEKKMPWSILIEDVLPQEFTFADGL